MKILEAPTKPAWLLKFTCTACGAELEADVADVKNVGYEMDDYYHVAFAVSCPLCKAKKELTSGEMAAYEKAKLLAKANKKLLAAKSE